MAIGLIISVSLISLVFFLSFLKKRKDSNSRSVDSSFSDISALKQSRYDFFLEKYNEAERRVIESADREIKQVQNQIEATSDPIKKQFLESFVEHYKYDKLSKLLYFSKYKDDDMVDDLDPLFTPAAEKIVTNQKFDYVSFLNWFGNSFVDISRYEHIIRQFVDCAVLDKNFEEGNYKICINNVSSLNKLIKKLNNHSLLTKDEKQELNNYFEQRYNELTDGHALYSELSVEVPDTYMNLVRAYDTLSSCKSMWEIISASANTEAKSYANTIIDKKSVFLHKKSFNYLKPNKDITVPHFEFKQGGISFYIYPEYVIAARSATNFEVISIKDFNISFQKIDFVEKNSYLIPKDAKLVRYTYKYVNKNGERDARYSNNPKYAVYEYGNITFQPFQFTMQFSNSEYADNFYKKVKAFKNGIIDSVESNFGATETYFNKALSVATPLCDFYDKILKNKLIMHTIDKALTDKVGDNVAKYRSLFLSDIIKCYCHLGHDATNLFTLEGLPMTMVEGHTMTKTSITYDTIQLAKYRNVVESTCRLNRLIIDNFLIDKSDDFFYMNEVFKACNTDDLRIQFFSLLYRFFSIIAKADNYISPDECIWLEKLMSYSAKSKDYGLNSFDKRSNEGEKLKKENNYEKESETNPMDDLQSLIGLSVVKDEVSALANFVKIQQERKKKGMKSVGLSYHCVFTGNPGTGKTTVARILASIYKELGILKKGHLIETDRSGLVAEYVGQTAVKTNNIIDSALDGVLFIDEAYSLVQGGGNDYGQEAISTLLKRMEDNRDRLIVVLAGYSEDMKRFIESNPGLQSRFNRYIHFSDYTADELKRIFLQNVENNQYLLDDEGQVLLDKILKFAIEHKDKNFGNGRYVRNLFEKTIQNQAMRLSCQPNITVEELSILKAEDLPRNK